jgi:hypothetical protein
MESHIIKEFEEIEEIIFEDWHSNAYLPSEGHSSDYLASLIDWDAIPWEDDCNAFQDLMDFEYYFWLDTTDEHDVWLDDNYVSQEEIDVLSFLEDGTYYIQ